MRGQKGLEKGMGTLWRFLLFNVVRSEILKRGGARSNAAQETWGKGTTGVNTREGERAT